MFVDRAIVRGRGAGESRSVLADLLQAVAHLPAARVDVHDEQRAVDIRVQSRRVARIDLRRGQALIYAPAGWARQLHRSFPSSTLTDHGLALDASSGRGSAEALRAIAARVELERFAGQYRDASP